MNMLTEDLVRLMTQERLAEAERLRVRRAARRRTAPAHQAPRPRRRAPLLARLSRRLGAPGVHVPTAAPRC